MCAFRSPIDAYADAIRVWPIVRRSVGRNAEQRPGSRRDLSSLLHGILPSSCSPRFSRTDRRRGIRQIGTKPLTPAWMIERIAHRRCVIVSPPAVGSGLERGSPFRASDARPIYVRMIV